MNFKSLDYFFNNIFKNYKFVTDLLLRFAVGVAFSIHGMNKFPLPPQDLIDYFGFNKYLASFVAICELFAGVLIIASGFKKTMIGNLLTRLSALIIVIIMIFAFYLAHGDWFINSKLFTSEQMFLFVIGVYFLINGNSRI